MSEMLNYFDVCSEINSTLKKIIKSFFVFSDIQGDNILFTTIDDKVFGFGSNIGGVCGLGHEIAVKTPQIIPELCANRVQLFCNGCDFVIGLTIDNIIYGWGKSDKGQILKTEPDILHKPQVICTLNPKVIQISCGLNHVLILTTDGDVYGWGSNNVGQVGCGQSFGKCVRQVTELTSISKIKLVHCSIERSFAVAIDGLVYSWGYSDRQLGHRFEGYEGIFEPRQIENLTDITSICSSSTCTYFVTYEGIIYVCGICDDNLSHDLPVILVSMGDSIELNSVYHTTKRLTSTAFSGGILYILDADKCIRTQYKSVFEYYAKECELTYNTIKFKSESTSESILEAEIITKVFCEDAVYNETIALLSNFYITQKIGILKNIIKVFHVFDDRIGFNIIFTTLYDDAYGYGSNQSGVCGLGHDIPIDEPKIINDLCYKNIKEIHNGMNFALALTGDNKLYGWGKNDCGQLARGIDNLTLFKASEIEFDTNITILQICCGPKCTLILTCDGCVYGFGDNKFGRIGCGKSMGKYVSRVTKLNNLSSIKTIQCSITSSFAIKNNGLVYIWGSNSLNKTEEEISNYLRCDFEPTLITQISNVKYICPSHTHTYFVTNDGLLYVSGILNSFRPEDIVYVDDLTSNHNMSKILSVHSVFCYQKHLTIGCLLTQHSAYELTESRLVKTNCKNMFEFFSTKYQLTYKSINFRIQNELNLVKLNILENNLIYPDYEIISIIDSGTFGTVYKLKHFISGEYYALKKFDSNKIAQDEIDIKYIRREFETMSLIKSQRIVEYIRTWIDINNDLNILMQFCSDNLKNIIEVKYKFFNRSKTCLISLLEYYISCNLFLEILCGVQYLHDQSPSIMHRDLKPANILFDELGKNGIFIKLCDFGLAKVQDVKSHTTEVGTPRYMAPEILKNKHYDIKSDIFSLSIIGEELFSIGLDNYDSVIEDSNIVDDYKQKFMNICNILLDMNSIRSSKRPNCSSIIMDKNTWMIDLNCVKNDHSFYEELDKVKSNAHESLSLNTYINYYLK